MNDGLRTVLLKVALIVVLVTVTVTVGGITVTAAVHIAGGGHPAELVGPVLVADATAVLGFVVVAWVANHDHDVAEFEEPPARPPALPAAARVGGGGR